MEENQKTVVCRTCGEPFIITESHEKWFVNKGLKAPTHCGWCRYLRLEVANAKLNRMQKLPA